LKSRSQSSTNEKRYKNYAQQANVITRTTKKMDNKRMVSIPILTGGTVFSFSFSQAQKKKDAAAAGKIRLSMIQVHTNSNF